MDTARLQRIDAFKDLSEHDLRQIALLGTESSVPVGAKVVEQDDFSNDIIGILEGAAEVTRDGEVLAQLGVGDIVGEAGVMKRGTRRNATVTATEPMVVFALGVGAVTRLRKVAPEVIRRLEDINDARHAPGAD